MAHTERGLSCAKEIFGDKPQNMLQYPAWLEAVNKAADLIAKHVAAEVEKANAWRGNHDDIAFYAFRYGLGRMTYAVSDIAKHLTDNWALISDGHKTIIHREIKEAIDNGVAGHDCDVAVWRTILSLPAAPAKQEA